MLLIYNIFLTCKYFVVLIAVGGARATIQEDLLSDLFTDYQSDVSPIETPDDKVDVYVGIAINRIIDVVRFHDKIYFPKYLLILLEYFECFTASVKGKTLQHYILRIS